MSKIEHREHSHSTALIMARLAAAAYVDASDLFGQVCRIVGSRNLIRVKTYDVPEAGTQAFLAECREFSVLSFRGTETDQLRDLLTDVRFAQRQGPFSSRHSKAHAGFWSGIKSLLGSGQGLLDDIDQATAGGKPFFITGHSLGGALATLMAAVISIDRSRQMSWPSLAPIAYTFGSPRVGNRGFAALYDHSVPLTFRYVNQDDLIPRLPWQLGRYRHIGQLYFIGSDLKVIREPSLWSYWIKRYISLSAGLLRFTVGGFKDHSMLGYIAGIAANQERQEI